MPAPTSSPKADATINHRRRGAGAAAGTNTAGPTRGTSSAVANPRSGWSRRLPRRGGRRSGLVMWSLPAPVGADSVAGCWRSPLIRGEMVRRGPPRSPRVYGSEIDVGLARRHSHLLVPRRRSWSRSLRSYEIEKHSDRRAVPRSGFLRYITVGLGESAPARLQCGLRMRAQGASHAFWFEKVGAR